MNRLVWCFDDDALYAVQPFVYIIPTQNHVVVYADTTNKKIKREREKEKEKTTTQKHTQKHERRGDWCRDTWAAFYPVQCTSLLSSAGTNAGSEVGCLELQTRANSVPINNTPLRGNERKSLYNRCRNIGGLSRPAGLWRWFGGNVRGILRIVQLHGMDTEKAWRSR